MVDGEGQRSLACCSPLGHKELDTTQRLNNKFALTPVMILKFVHLFFCCKRECVIKKKKKKKRERENVSYYLVLHLEVESRNSQFFAFLFATIDLHSIQTGLYTKISG